MNPDVNSFITAATPADAQDIAGVLIRSRVPFDCLGCHFGLRKRYEPLARTLIAEALAASRYTFS